MNQIALQYGHITDEALFYGFILSCHINIRWQLGNNGGMSNPKLFDIVREYLDFVCVDEWSKRPVLDVARESKTDVRKRAKQLFPSLFHKVRQKPLQVPEELVSQNIPFDIDFFNNLRDRTTSIKREVTTMNMNDNDPQSPFAANNTKTVNTTNTEETNNFMPTENSSDAYVINGIEINSPDAYRQATGKRFRMTKEQKSRFDSGTLTRAEAFNEFVAYQRNQGNS